MGSGQQSESLFVAVVDPCRGEGRIGNLQFDATRNQVTVDLVDGAQLLVGLYGEGVSYRHIGPDGATVRQLNAEPEPVGQLGKLDREDRTVRIRGDGAVSVGDLLIFENDLGRNTFYRAEQVGPGGEVRVGDRWTDLRIATGYLTGGSEGNGLEYDDTYIIQEPIRAQCRGARIVNEEGNELRVVQVDADAIVFDAGPGECARFPVDSTGDGRMAFDIYDFGEGDSVSRIRVRDSLPSRDLDQGGRSV